MRFWFWWLAGMFCAVGAGLLVVVLASPWSFPALLVGMLCGYRSHVEMEKRLRGVR